MAAWRSKVALGILLCAGTIVTAAGVWLLARKPVLEWWWLRELEAAVKDEDQVQRSRLVANLARLGSLKAVPAIVDWLDATPILFGSTSASGYTFLADSAALESPEIEAVRADLLRMGASMVPLLVDTLIVQRATGLNRFAGQQLDLSQRETYRLLLHFGPVAVPVIREVLDRVADEGADSRLLSLLQDLGPEACSATPEVNACFATSSWRSEVLFTLAAIGAPQRLLVQRTAECLESRDHIALDDAVFGLECVEATQRTSFVPTLAERLEECNCEQRVWCPPRRSPIVLRTLGQDAAQGVPLLVRILLERRFENPETALAETLAQGSEETAAAARRILSETLRSSSDPFVRWRAAILLRQTAKAAGAPIDALLAAPSDEDLGLRREIAVTLGVLRSDAARCIPVLIRWLDDEGVEVRLAAAEAIGEFGVEAAAALPRLIEIVRAATTGPPQSLEWDLERLVERCIRAIGRSGSAAVGLDDRVELLALLLRSGPELTVRLAAAEALLVLGEAARPAAPALRDAAASDVIALRLRAAMALAQLGEGVAGVESAFRQVVEGSAGEFSMLPGAFGDLELASARLETALAVPAIALRDARSRVRIRAIEALRQRPRLLRASSPHVLAACADRDPEVRLAAIEAAAELGPLDPALQRSLLQLAADGSLKVSERLANAASDADALTASSRPARIAAARALIATARALPVSEGVGLLLEVLRVGDEAGRFGAIEALEATDAPDPRIIPALKAAYRAEPTCNWEDPDDRKLRLAIGRLFRQLDGR